jgi:16S rRNA (uracil1498-N3)-methyltransferase
LTVPRLYFPRNLEESDRFELGKENLRYVKSVLRMKKGDRLMLFDGSGRECETLISRITKDAFVLEVTKRCTPREKGIFITLMQSLPKANKMDFIVQKATELGVGRIVPFLSSRSVPRLSTEKAGHKVMRWRNIAVEAARQCGRANVPGIDEFLSYEEALTQTDNESLNMIFWEEETGKGVRDILTDRRHDGVKAISFIVGPEGGFAKEEVARAAEKGFVSVSLGRQVLKVETAALTILSIVQYEKGMFSGASPGEKSR